MEWGFAFKVWVTVVFGGACVGLIRLVWRL